MKRKHAICKRGQWACVKDERYSDSSKLGLCLFLGLARHTKGRHAPTTHCGTVSYMAPEIRAGNDINGYGTIVGTFYLFLKFYLTVKARQQVTFQPDSPFFFMVSIFDRYTTDSWSVGVLLFRM